MFSRLMRFDALLWISALALAGCSSTKSVFPQDAPTMQEIYDRHFEQAEHEDVDRSGLGGRGTGDGSSGLAGFTRAAYNEIDALFPRLPNPTLVMYVFPHLAGDDGVGIPGYATSFSFYEKVEYALPGEVAVNFRPLIPESVPSARYAGSRAGADPTDPGLPVVYRPLGTPRQSP
jgi:conjugative transfer region lipoprotein (TIGR03751 family)